MLLRWLKMDLSLLGNIFFKKSFRALKSISETLLTCSKIQFWVIWLMNRTALVNVIAFLFIILFLYTAVEKFMEINTFRDQLLSSPLLRGYAKILTWALPVVEVILAIILLIPRFRLLGLYASLSMMVAFTIYVLIIIHIDDNISCSCGGIIENLSPRVHIFFNMIAVGLAAIGIWAARRHNSTLYFRRITSLTALLLLGGATWIILIAAKAPKKTITGMEGRLLPKFNLLLADSVTQFNTADIPTGKPFIMVGFSPWCPHCQMEMVDIIGHIQRFGDTTVYYVTSFPYHDMKMFHDAYHLEKYPDIVIGVDTANMFMRYFRGSTIPYIAIFDAKKRLKEVIPGQVSFNTLISGLDD